jgi:hypothetical protein
MLLMIASEGNKPEMVAVTLAINDDGATRRKGKPRSWLVLPVLLNGAGWPGSDCSKDCKQALLITLASKGGNWITGKAEVSAHAVSLKASISVKEANCGARISPSASWLRTRACEAGAK